MSNDVKTKIYINKTTDRRLLGHEQLVILNHLSCPSGGVSTKLSCLVSHFKVQDTLQSATSREKIYYSSMVRGGGTLLETKYLSKFSFSQSVTVATFTNFRTVSQSDSTARSLECGFESYPDPILICCLSFVFSAVTE